MGKKKTSRRSPKKSLLKCILNNLTILWPNFIFKTFFSVAQFSWENVISGCHLSSPLDFYEFGDSHKATTSTRLGLYSGAFVFLNVLSIMYVNKCGQREYLSKCKSRFL